MTQKHNSLRKFTQNTAIYIVLVLLVAVYSNPSQKPTAQNNQLVVIAQLIEQPYALKVNPIYKPVYIFKYKIKKVVSGKIKDKIILVGHYNPAVSRALISDKMQGKVSGNLDKLVAGQIHELTLVQPLKSVWTDAIEDEYFDDESMRYFAIIANKSNSAK